MKAKKDVHITIHVDHNGLKAVGDPDDTPSPGDTIIWKTCEALHGCHVHICDFRDAATGKAKNPTRGDQYDADAQGKVIAELREEGDVPGDYKYTIRVVTQAKAARMVERCVTMYAAAISRESGASEAAATQQTFVDAGRHIPVKHLMEFAQMVQTEHGFARAMMAMQLDGDCEMNPELQVGGGPHNA